MATLKIRENSFCIRLAASENENRATITIGRVITGRRKRGEQGYTEQEATVFKANIETLIHCQCTGQPLTETLSEWAENLSSAHRRRLVVLGIIEPSERKKTLTVRKWTADYIKLKEQDKRLKLSTLKKYYATQRKINTFFRKELLVDVTPRLALQFRNYLRNACGLCENTTAKHICHTKEIFAFAVENELVKKNPFKGQGTNVKPNPARFFYVTPELAREVLEACPDVEWRLIFALARFGGLRTPSETLRLKWEDINFEKNVIIVRASKTEHHEGGGVRKTPLFAELESLLLEAYEKAEPGAVYVIEQHRGENLRTQFTRILTRAGIVPWPKLFQNCRSTRETELFKLTQGNVKAVCQWIGNSEQVALKHYAQVTDEDSRQIALINVLEACSNSAEICTPKCTPPEVETGRNGLQHTPENTPQDSYVSGLFAAICNKKAAPCNDMQKAARWAISDSNQ
ncbi:MAG: tyrosine-type recombinase/integrase [Phycisphaerae bacterium]